MILEVTGDALEGHGKASVVGMGGEVEHARAIPHTLWFGNQYREAVVRRPIWRSRTRAGQPERLW